MDRLLPFEFEVIHALGRTLGIADYLSRHPSPIYDESLKAEERWNIWLAVNHVNAFNSLLAKQIEEPIKSQQHDRTSATASLPQTTEDNLKSIALSLINNTQDKLSVNKMATQNEAFISFEEICYVDLRTSSSVNPEQSIKNYSIIHNLDKNVMLAKQIIEIYEKPNKTKIHKLPAPWCETFSTLSVDNNGDIYMDDRVVVPRALSTGLQRSFHWRHHGRDETLRKSSDFWWPQIHRDVILCVKTC